MSDLSSYFALTLPVLQWDARFLVSQHFPTSACITDFLFLIPLFLTFSAIFLFPHL